MPRLFCDAVRSSIPVIRKAPSPTMVTTSCSGFDSFVPMAAGTAQPIQLKSLGEMKCRLSYWAQSSAVRKVWFPSSATKQVERGISALNSLKNNQSNIIGTKYLFYAFRNNLKVSQLKISCNSRQSGKSRYYSNIFNYFKILNLIYNLKNFQNA